MLNTHAFAWDELIRFEASGRKVLLEFDPESALVRVKHKKQDSSGIYKNGLQISVDSPTAVDSALSEIKSLFTNELHIEEENPRAQLALERVEEFKYISKKECSALHFDIGSTSSSSEVIETLLDQVNKIRIAQSPGTDATRSIRISTFETKEGPIQLRMVLGPDGEFLKFSFAKSEGSLVNFDWVQSESTVTLLSPDREVILEIDTETFRNSGGLITAKSRNESGLEEESRSFFRLVQSSAEQGTRWQVTAYNTSHFNSSVIKSGVALTTTVAEHTPVIQLNDRELVFRRLSLDKIKSLDILKDLELENQSKLEGIYNKCMGERLSFLYEEQRFKAESSAIDESIQSDICLKKTQAEAIAEVLGLSQGNSLSEFKACLKEKGIGSQNSSFFSFSNELLTSMTSQEYELDLLECFRKQKEFQLSLELSNSVKASVVLREVLPGEKSITLLSNEIQTPYKENCIEVAPLEHLEECKVYSDQIVNDLVFNSMLSSRLINMNGLIRNASDIGTDVVLSPLEKCHEQRDQRIKELMGSENSESKVGSELQENGVECAKGVLINFSDLLDKSFFSSALTRAGLIDDSNVEISEDRLKEMRRSLKECWKEQLMNENSLSDMAEEMDYHLEACLPEVVKNEVALLLESEFSELSEHFLPFKGLSESEQSDMASQISGLIKDELGNWKELERLEEVRTSLLPKVFAKVFEQHILHSSNSMAEGDETKILEFQNIALRSVGARSLDEFASKSISFFASQPKSVENSFVDTSKIALRELLKQFYLQTSEGVSQVEGDGNLQVGIAGREAFVECFKDYAANSSEKIKRQYIKCEKNRMARVTLFKAIEENEAKVGVLMPLTSVDANTILETNQYLGHCFSQANEAEDLSLADYEQALENCKKLAHFDLSLSLVLAQVDSYKEISQLADERKEQVLSCFYKGVSEHLDLDESDASLLRSSYNEVRDRSLLGGGLLSMLPGAHVENGSHGPEISALMKKLTVGDLFKEENGETLFREQIVECENRTNSLIKGEFREYVIRSVPSLDLYDDEDPNTQLMRDFLDVELVDLIMEFQKVNEAKLVGNRVQILESELESRLITSDLGISMLTNFVDLLGDLIGKGFMYDEAAMRTELVVFQSELKGFLRWYTTNADMVSIDQAQDFFEQSKLAEHLSMAVVSEKVYESFLTGMAEMRKKELNELFEGKSCYDSERCLWGSDRAKYRAINTKYDDLRKLAREMTSSYDFRRIIRPESDQGREIIAAIKDSYLMPKVVGQRMNARAEEDMMKIIGEAILRDNTDGGFADRFVHIMAQAELDRESQSRYGLTKWLFFDDKDFDWETLKQTDAGQRAMDYYSRFIMLPQAMGRPLGTYELKLRKDRFRRLISSAQIRNSK